MRQRLVIFVEGPAVNQFWPLAVSRPPYLLRCGATLLWEKWIPRLRPERLRFFTRPELAGIVAEKTGNLVNQSEDWTGADVWVLDGRWILSAARDFDPGRIPEECLLRCADRTVGLRFHGEKTSVSHTVSEWLRTGARGSFPDTGLPPGDVSGKIIDYLWDVVDYNPEQIGLDFASLAGGKPGQWPPGVVDRTAVVTNPERTFIGEGARIGPQTVLDARGGAIIIDKNAVINPHTYIEGPAVVGPSSTLFGGKIRAGTTIGPVCRVGGEIEASVFLGWANKCHDGFLGHCIIGEWVNLGALTTNSDLKNNYRPVRVELPGQVVDTGRIKVGSYLADHTKTGVGTLLPSGGTVGFASNIFGGGAVAPKMIPEFVWGGDGGFVEHRLAQAKQTAAEVHRRRNVEFTDEEAGLFDLIFEQSKRHRDTFLSMKR